LLGLVSLTYTNDRAAAEKETGPRLVKHLDLLSSPPHRPMELRGIIPFAGTGGDEELRISLQLATIQDTSIRTVSPPTPIVDQDRAEASRLERLAIGRLAERRSILRSHTNRTIALPRQRGVVDDQYRILATDQPE